MPHKRKRSRYWWVSYTDAGGRRVRRSTGTTNRKEAEALEARWKLESFRAQQWDDEPSRTFDEMMLVYLQETREKTSHQRDLNAAVHLHVHFTGCELNRLRASDIRA